MMRYARISLVVLVLIGSFVLVVPGTGRTASLSLSVPNGMPGKTVKGTIGFKDATDVAYFSLTLSFASGKPLTTKASKFKPNITFFPSSGRIAGKQANFAMDITAGEISFVGLSPQPTKGSVNVGTLDFTIAGSANPNDTQVITLSGKVCTKAGQVIELIPYSVTFTVPGAKAQEGSLEGEDAAGINSSEQLPDAWKLKYFGDLSRSGKGDFDHDGYSDLCEYQNGTNPKVPDPPNGPCYDPKTDKRTKKGLPAIDLLLRQ